jgi:hypothetical protein
MWLVLCDDLDTSARWVYEELLKRSLAVEFIPASALAHAVRLVHRVGPGATTAELLLADGRRVTSTKVRATLNRMLGPSSSPEWGRGPDSEYAMQEMLSLYVSLLRCLPGPILNPPSAQGLSGRLRYTPEWYVLAARSGFATRPFAVSSEDGFDDSRDREVAPGTAARMHNVIVAADEVFGDPLSQADRAAACELARLAGLQLLGLHLATGSDGATWFEAADLYPDLRAGGVPLIDHLAQLVPAELAT